MARSVLVAYATKRGSTREVAEAVAATLGEQGLRVELQPAGEVKDVSCYDGVVLGGALYMGRWHGDARRFLMRHREALALLPVAVFGMGPLTLAEKDVAGSRRQLERALAKAPEVEPVSVAIFGAVVDPAKLRFPFSRMPATDARNWDAIHAWSDKVATELGALETAIPEAVTVAHSVQ
jgi:menaquinone-dependent protoporphyrinogen oxidase